ncbi:hypothetical protein [Clostridium sp. BJN0001]|uniref:hypothetical protein n=1 Tax=Clostridium sp. BJN0001 TaxID=2930219 RepID=UPI001FD19DB2|nr:hypothetical protein [Clostridium sp. BJN0001]
MSLKDKFNGYFQSVYMQKYGDRITSNQGTVLSVKLVEKNYFIIKLLSAELVLKPQVGKGIVKCYYNKKRWFKKPEFITLKQGHKVIIMGLKGAKTTKKHSIEDIQVINIINLTTNKDLVPVDHSQIKKARQQANSMMMRK